MTAYSNPNVPTGIKLAMENLVTIEQELHDTPLPDGRDRTPEMIAAAAPILALAQVFYGIESTLETRLEALEGSLENIHGVLGDIKDALQE